MLVRSSRVEMAAQTVRAEHREPSDLGRVVHGRGVKVIVVAEFALNGAFVLWLPPVLVEHREMFSHRRHGQ